MSTTFSSKYKELFPWCAADTRDNKSAKCLWCNKSFKIDTMGKVAFSSHEKSKKHQLEANTRRTNVRMSSFTVTIGSKTPTVGKFLNFSLQFNEIMSKMV